MGHCVCRPDAEYVCAWCRVTDLATDLHAENEQLRAELAQHKRLQTLGGPPPPVTKTWNNTRLPGGVHADYQGRL